MVFNATFNNISVISWRSVLLVEEAGVHGENPRPVARHCQTLSHNVIHLLLEIQKYSFKSVNSSDTISKYLYFIFVYKTMIKKHYLQENKFIYNVITNIMYRRGQLFLHCVLSEDYNKL